MDSANYKLFRQAIAKKMQIVCTYHGKHREVCPIVLGHTGDEEKALVYQIGGQSSRGLGGAANWRCFSLAEVMGASLRDGPWAAGASHMKRQPCVAQVEFDVNPNSPYVPSRRR